MGTQPSGPPSRRARRTTYTFTVTFNDGGPNGADNHYKSAPVTTGFNWEAVNN